MMVRLSRLVLIFLVIVVAAVYLPKYYWLSFEKRIVEPTVYYSPLKKDFIIGKYGTHFFWQDRFGKIFNRDQIDSLLPFFNYRLLAARGKMPAFIDGVKIDLETVRLNNITERIRPKEIRIPEIPLYPLFESKPPRLRLTLPPSFFRIGRRMEFITAKTNTIDQALSQKFTQALKAQNFIFPAKRIFGNPTTRKPFDEGYFVIDSADQLFHIKMIRGRPFCANTHLPASVKIRFLFVKENPLKEFYAVVISQTNQIYLLMYDRYRLQKLPVTGYHADADKLYLRANLFYRAITVYHKNSLKTIVTNRKYKLVARYTESWPGKMDLPAGKLSVYLFPFTLKLMSAKSYFVQFYFEHFSYLAGILNVILLISLLFSKRYRGRLALKRWYDLLIVLITGIYGFIAILILENTDA